eukprot:TRINITY_DN71274_c0_g1_i1.p1 TRINITY_DN71274_c0_g1~~TRINITY_DN71274_c0_g1_i1.p1  ORF type:complete len:252 (+),score=22.72 TRINITY_DN71274_c0_g1_i1:165-920(+)
MSTIKEYLANADSSSPRLPPHMSGSAELGTLTRYVAKRVSRCYNPAIAATHDVSNGVLRSTTDAWKAPTTGDRHRVLAATSAIIDTDVRQKSARFLMDSLNEARSDVPKPKPPEVGLNMSLSYDGHWRPAARSRSVPQEDRPWLPPWVSKEQWDLIAKPSPPSWSGVAYASTSTPQLWAGATIPPTRQPLAKTPTSTPSLRSTMKTPTRTPTPAFSTRTLTPEVRIPSRSSTGGHRGRPTSMSSQRLFGNS